MVGGVGVRGVCVVGCDLVLCDGWGLCGFVFLCFVRGVVVACCGVGGLGDVFFCVVGVFVFGGVFVGVCCVVKEMIYIYKYQKGLYKVG